jgi:hypothetical protein
VFITNKAAPMAPIAKIAPTIMNNLALDFDLGNWVPQPAQKSVASSIDMPQLLQVFTADPHYRFQIEEFQVQV